MCGQAGCTTASTGTRLQPCDNPVRLAPALRYRPPRTAPPRPGCFLESHLALEGWCGTRLHPVFVSLCGRTSHRAHVHLPTYSSLCLVANLLWWICIARKGSRQCFNRTRLLPLHHVRPQCVQPCAPNQLTMQCCFSQCSSVRAMHGRLFGPCILILSVSPSVFLCCVWVRTLAYTCKRLFPVHPDRV